MLLPFCSTVFSSFKKIFIYFFNDPKFALVIHSTNNSILRCFTGVTLGSQSHFSRFLSDHILIAYAYSLPACLGQMIILTLSNASLSLCLKIYYPQNVHGHCRGTSSYCLFVIFWNLFFNQHFCSSAVRWILKVKYKVISTRYIWTFCFMFLLNFFLVLSSYLTFKIHEDPNIVHIGWHLWPKYKIFFWSNEILTSGGQDVAISHLSSSYIASAHFIVLKLNYLLLKRNY